MKIVDTPDFPSGKKSLLLNCLEGKAEIISTQIPAIPGKEIEVRFFAKSKKRDKNQEKKKSF